jgi:hypothetical protein
MAPYIVPKPQLKVKASQKINQDPCILTLWKIQLKLPNPFANPPSVYEIPGFRRIRVHIHQLDRHLVPLRLWLVFPSEVVQDNVQGIPVLNSS